MESLRLSRRRYGRGETAIPAVGDREPAERGDLNETRRHRRRGPAGVKSSTRLATTNSSDAHYCGDAAGAAPPASLVHAGQGPEHLSLRPMRPAEPHAPQAVPHGGDFVAGLLGNAPSIRAGVLLGELAVVRPLAARLLAESRQCDRGQPAGL